MLPGMLRTLAVVLLLAGAACRHAHHIRPIESETGLVVCTGTIVSISTVAGEDWRIVLQPDPGCAGLLAAGQQHLPCELPLSHSKYAGRFEPILRGLKVGARLEVAGFHVADDREGGIHKIRPWTSLDPHP
jgi:hypothetical protein